MKGALWAAYYPLLEKKLPPEKRLAIHEREIENDLTGPRSSVNSP